MFESNFHDQKLFIRSLSLSFFFSLAPCGSWFTSLPPASFSIYFSQWLCYLKLFMNYYLHSMCFLYELYTVFTVYNSLVFLLFCCFSFTCVLLLYVVFFFMQVNLLYDDLNYNFMTKNSIIKHLCLLDI